MVNLCCAVKSYFLNPFLNFILCAFNPVFFSFYILIRKKSYISLALPSHVLLEFKYDLQCLNPVLLQLILKRSFSPVEGQCSCCIVTPSWHLLWSIFIFLNRIIHMSVTNIGMLTIFIAGGIPAPKDLHQCPLKSVIFYIKNSTICIKSNTCHHYSLMPFVMVPFGFW